MSSKVVVSAEHGFKSPLMSQAIIHNGTVYVSGNVGIIPSTNQLVEGSVADRARQAIKNLEVVLHQAGSDLHKMLKATIYLTNMQNYAAVNKVWMEMIPEPKPARTCVAVAQLPMGTDVEIECIAHLNVVATMPKL